MSEYFGSIFEATGGELLIKKRKIFIRMVFVFAETSN